MKTFKTVNEKCSKENKRDCDFNNVVYEEDYVMAASSQVGAASGAQTHITFGRNEPALHHYHNTYRQALGMPPLDVISN